MVFWQCDFNTFFCLVSSFNYLFVSFIHKHCRRLWNTTEIRPWRIKTFFILTLFRMVLFGAAHGWARGREVQKRSDSLKSVTHILQWKGTVSNGRILSKRKDSKYFEARDHPFTTYAKFSEILLFPTPNTQAYVYISGDKKC